MYCQAAYDASHLLNHIPIYRMLINQIRNYVQQLNLPDK